MDLLKHANCNMRPHVCIPSGCQQWTSKTIAVGIDKFAYMSTMAIYVYSSVTYLPLAILAKHEERLSAIALSPFDSNLLACAITNQEVRVYDVDTELPVCRLHYTSPKGKVSHVEWHRTNPGVLLLAVESCLVAWDFTAAVEMQGTQGQHANGNSGNHGRVNSVQNSAVVPPTAPSSPPLSSRSPVAPRSMLMRLRNARGLQSNGTDATAAAGGAAGRWVPLRDVGAEVTAMDQCASGGSVTAGLTRVAIATADSKIIILELDSSGLALRGELRTITLPDATATPSLFGGGGGIAGLAGIGPASTICWEPLSGNGLLLIVGRSGVMALYDTTADNVVLSYGKQPATATRFAQFLPSQPGNFLLSSSRSGALQCWNVSQPQPQRLFKLGGGLVQGFALLRTTTSGGGGDATTTAGGTASGKLRTAVLVSFTDGAVFSYDLESQQVLWRQEGGHTETVFDCRFCSSDPNLLATASFDSTVRVWDVRTARCVKHLLGGEGILYSVSWSADGRLLAASNDSGVIFLYDYARGMLLKTLKLHTKESLRVAFHPHRATLLASASLDGSVLVYTTDGEMVRILRHSAPVSCIAWSSLAPSLLASTSEDGELFVWDVSRPPKEDLVRTLLKHSARSFNVEFSPLLRNHLLSSSNDCTARVWDVSTGDCLAVLAGHTEKVRAVAWHPEVSYICFTGSWDASVRVWDVRTGYCLHVANDHHADVYGIACHPRRPFFIVTCSRDTTLRLWSTLGLTPNLLSQVLVRPLPSFRGAAEEAASMPLSAGPVMSGVGSQELADRLAATSCTPLERSAAITEFFLPPACMDVFWDIVKCVRFGSGAGCGDSGGGVVLGHLPVRQRSAAAIGADGGGGFASGCCDDGTSLHHWTSARLAVGSAANHMELAANSKARLGSGSARREELLREAAQQHLLAGNVEHCCDLHAEVGDWDRALALAPMAGMALWQRLLRQRLQALTEGEAQSHVNDVLPLYLVSGQVPELVEMLTASCLYDTAFNVAAVQASGGYPGLANGGCGGGGACGGGAQRASGGGSAGGGRSSGAGSVASANGGDMLPPLPRPPSPGVGTLTASQSAVGLATLAIPSGLELVRSSTTELSAMGFSAASGAAAAAVANGVGGVGLGVGGGNFGLAPLTLPLASSVSMLPPLTGRGGMLPSLNRSPSVRPPTLLPIQLSASAAAVVAPPSPLSPLLVSSRPGSPPTNTSATSGTPLNDTGPLPLAPAPFTTATTQGFPTLPVPPLTPSSPLAPTPPSSLRAGPSLSIRQSRCATTVGGGSGGGVVLTEGAGIGSASGRMGREAFDRAVGVRCAQARGFLAQGLPLQAACCALTVDDVAGAVGLLLRGGQEEMALALLSGLTRPVAAFPQAAAGPGTGPGSGLFGVGLESSGSGGGGTGLGSATSGGVEAAAAVLRPRVLVAAACRREAAGDYVTAAELLKQVPTRIDLRDMLAGRCRAHADPSTAGRVFSCLGLKEPGHYMAAAEAPGVVAADAGAGWEGIRRLLLAGQQAAAADRALHGIRLLLEAGERVTILSPDWEQAWGAVNSLEASALGESVWSRVFSYAAYLGALLALEQGCASVGLYLVRVLEDWVAKQSDAELPVSHSRLAGEISGALDECLALPAYGSPGEVREALLDLVLAPPGSSWMQGMLQARLAQFEPRLSVQIPSAPMSPGRRSIRSPPQGSGSGGAGAGAGGEGLMSPSASSSFLTGRRLGVGGGASSLRLSSLDLGPGSGRISAALSTLQHTGGGVEGAGGSGRRRSGGDGGTTATSLVELARGPVVVAAAHVPTRSSSSMVASGGLPTSTVSGVAVRGAAVRLDDGATWISLSEALALRRVMSYSPLGSGRLLLVP